MCVYCDVMFLTVNNQATVEEWERKLNIFAKTLEEWMACQRNWLYIEQIFSTPDIQKYVSLSPYMDTYCEPVCIPPVNEIRGKQTVGQTGVWSVDEMLCLKLRPQFSSHLNAT